MAKKATEYKDELLRKLNGDAFLADKEVAFLTRELEYAETTAIAVQMSDKIEEASYLSEFLKAAALALEDVDATI